MTLDQSAEPTGVANNATTLYTQPGEIFGTPGYMSPEQICGRPLSAASDVFAFGCVLYESLTGRRPFKGDTHAKIFEATLTQQPRPIRTLAATAPKPLIALIKRCLEKDPEDRFQSGGEIAAELSTIQIAASGRSRALRLSHRVAISIAAVLLVALATGIYLFVHKGPIDSIAVVPFTTDGSDVSLEYGDALADSILNTLSKLPSIRVMARSTMAHYRGPNADPRKIGSELHVRSALLGKVLWRSGHLKITTELVNTSDGSRLWSQEYDVPVSDVFAAEQQITRDICGELRLRLTGAEQDRIKPARSENADVYQLYLKGRYFWNKRSPEGFEKAIEFYKQALDIDPTSALPWAGLASTYMFQGGTKRPSDIFPQAKAAAMKAMELDSKLAEPHFVLGYIDIQYFWNWQEAEKEFGRAIELNPGYAIGHSAYGRYLGIMGRTPECVEQFQRAQSLDPLSVGIVAGLGLCYYWAGQYDAAISQFKKTLDIEPRFAVGWWDLASTYTQKRMFNEAFAAFEKGFAISPDDAGAVADYSFAYASAGRRADATRLLEKLNEMSKRRFVSPYFFAIAHTGLGDKDSAFEWLEKAYQQRSYLTLLKVEPELTSLRSDPRFSNLVRRVGLGQ